MNKLDKKELLSIPNCMGYFRILLIPIFCYFYVKAETRRDYSIAAGIVVISTITDFLDGFVARKFQMITEFGKFLDPVADKLTHGAIAICLMIRYPNMRYLVALMVIKEGYMAVVGWLNLKQGRKLDGAKIYGKVCTATLFLLLFILVLFPGIPDSYANICIAIEMLIMLMTLILYALEYQKLQKI